MTEHKHDEGTAAPSSAAPKGLPRREEFFIHPDILRGTAGYRTVSRSRRTAPTDDDPAAPAASHL